MNNEINKVIGIGLIKNRIYPKQNKIYSDNNYNRYTYLGKKWIDYSLIDTETLECLEERLFKGKRHLKRSQGIAQVPKDVEKEFQNYIVSLYNIVFC